MVGQRHPGIDKRSVYASHTISYMVKNDQSDIFFKNWLIQSYRSPTQWGL